MPSELNTRAKELKQTLLDLQAAGQTTTVEMQDLLGFLDRLASGKMLSGFDYLTGGLQQLSTALRQMGMSAGEITKLNQNLINLTLTSRILREEFSQLGLAPQGIGGPALRGFQPQPVNREAVLGAGKTMWKKGILAGLYEEDQEAYQKYISMLQTLENRVARVKQNIANKTGRPVGGAIPGQRPIEDEDKFARVTPEFYRNLGLSADATDRLQQKLESFGLTGAKVVTNTKELSTGIRRLKFQALDPTSKAVTTFTATLDKNGNILDDTQKRFRTFGSAIIRDTVEVLKWSIAVGIVYGVFRKFSELIESATVIQAGLAEVQIAVGRSTADLSKIFESAAQIADETSSSVEGVVDGFKEAYAAAGSVGNAYERMATAQALLRDSMVLSVLAGIDQSEALDTLVGALRQTGLELYEGQQLLDGWVAVSKNANVSLNQLASTFAIVGTAAEGVGITAHELNAVVGALAEATKLSADETGNAIRGFISGFQSAKAEETLAKFGIAVRTTTGEVRPFLDLLEELSVLSARGVLSEREIAEITNVIGGGFRRGAQLAALMENYNRVLQLTEISQNANGDAADALGIKMDTLQAATTRLNNAFTAFGQTLGGEGGLIGMLTSFTNVATTTVQSIESLVSVLGNAAPYLATLLAISAITRTGTGAGFLLKTLPLGLATALAPNTAQLIGRGESAIGGYSRLQPGAGRLGGALMPPLEMTQAGLQAPTWGAFFANLNKTISSAFSKIPGVGGRLGGAFSGVGGLLVPGTLIASQAVGGQWEKAGATLLGTFVGGLTGNPVFAAAGAIMGSAFYDAFLDFEGDFASRWAEILIDAQRQADEEAGVGTDREKSIAELEQAVLDTMSEFEKFNVNARTYALNLGELGREIALGIASSITGVEAPESAGRLSNIDVLTATFFKQQQLGGGRFEAQGAERFIYGVRGLDEDTYNALNELMNEFFIDQMEQGLLETKTQALVITNKEKVAGIAATAAEDLITKALDDISVGVSGSVERYIDANKIQTQLSLSAAKIITAMTAAAEVAPGTGIQVPTGAEAIGFVAGLTQDEAQVITQLTGQILANYEKITELQAKPVLEAEDTRQLEEYNQQIIQASGNLQALYESLRQATLIREAELLVKPIIDLPDDLTGEQYQQIIESADRLWTQALIAMGMNEEQLAAYKAREGEKLLRANMEILDFGTNVPQEFIRQAGEQLGLAATSSWSFADLRSKGLSLGNIGAVLNRYAQIFSAFSQIPQFEADFNPVTLILKDGFKTLDLDMRLFNLALQELIDIEREQMVEGMFNLPGGATFFVPWEPAALDARSRLGDAFGGLDPESFFNQFPADPDAFAGSTEEGAYAGTFKGITEGLQKLPFDKYATGREADPLRSDLTKEWWDERFKNITQPTYDVQRTQTLQGFDFEKTNAEKWADILGLGDIFSTLKEEITKRGGVDTREAELPPWMTSLFETFYKIQEFLSIPLTSGQQSTTTPEETLPPWLNNFYERLLSVQEFLSIPLTGQEPTSAVPPELTSNLGMLAAGITGLTTLLSFLQLQDTSGPTSTALKGMEKEVTKSLETTLNLNIQSTTQVAIDGRVIAEAVKAYLHEDMLRYDDTGGAINRVVIV